MTSRPAPELGDCAHGFPVWWWRRINRIASYPPADDFPRGGYLATPAGMEIGWPINFYAAHYMLDVTCRISFIFPLLFWLGLDVGPLCIGAAGAVKCMAPGLMKSYNLANLTLKLICNH